MRYFLLLSFVFLFGCVRKPPPSKFPDPVAEALNEWAEQMAKQLPEKSKVIVMNFKNPEKLYYTYLGRDLTKKFFQSLSTCSRVSPIPREWGEIVVEEEKKYTPDEWTQEELKKLLENFQADYAIIGEYELTDGLIIFNTLQAIPTLGGEAKGVKLHNIEISGSTFSRYQKKDSSPLFVPSRAREVPFFFREHGEWDAIERVSLVTLSGEEIPRGQEVSIGTYYRAKITLKPERLPVYLYAFGWDDKNDVVTILYPMNIEPYDVITEPEVIIPREKCYRAEPPPGHNWLVVIAVEEEDKIGMEPTDRWREDPMSVLPDFKQELDVLGEENWSSGRVEFWIKE